MAPGLRRRTIVLCLLAELACGLWGLNPAKRVTQYAINVWKSERGLPNSSVLAIAQDRRGFLWLGTAEGLVRFDGVNFTIYNSGNIPAFQDNFVNNLHVDRRGVLWIGTLRGKLLSMERGEFRDHPFPDDVSRISYSCIAEDARGDLWVGTSAGLFRFPAGSDSPPVRQPGLANVPIMALAVDDAGRLVTSVAGGGLQRLENGAWRTLVPGSALVPREIFIIRSSHDGSLWLGTDDGLIRFRGGRWQDVSPPEGLNSLVTALVEDRDGNVWVGSENGLYRWHDGDWQFLGRSKGIDSDYVYAVHEDVEGSLWVGALDGGLIQVRDEKITAYTDREGLAGSKFRCLHGGASGELWIGGGGGYLNRYRNGRCDSFALPGAARNHAVYSLETGADGALWLGTSDGLLRFREGRARAVPLPGVRRGVEVRCLARDPAGRLWAGTWGQGIFVVGNGRTKRFGAAAGLPGDLVSSLRIDRAGNVWAGCDNGLAVLRAAGGGRFTAEPFLAGCQVNSFLEDDAGNLWVGTKQGIKVFRDGRWGSVGTDQGLFDSRVYAILKDGTGDMWLSSERGIFRVGAGELEAAAFDRTRRVAGRMFDENDGMKSRICNYGNPAGWRDADGRLWFANLVGVASVDPAAIRPSSRVPPVLIEEAVADGRRLPLAGEGVAGSWTLPAGSRKLEFTYTALSLVRSDRIVFRYRLDGYDRDWVNAGSRRQAFYNDLRPGRYRFRVIAASADGVWNRADASFAFVLRPFVWQTAWFLALAVLAFAALSGATWQLLRRYLRAVSFWKKRTQVGHYRLLETIGSGGMATVYRARDLLGQGRVVALKLLKEENFHDEAQKRRFRHESLITATLDHPHVVSVFERGETGDCFYIAMELLEGISLARLMRSRGPLPLADAVTIMRQVVDALGAIHCRQIVHRDLKPENVMICERPGQPLFVKLLDFGLAITPAQSRLTMSGVVMGTVRYLPPERIRDGVSSPAGDIYSAGIILYEMLTDTKPFWSEGTGEVIHRILDTEPLPAREINPAVPPEAGALIAAMIDKDPARRPSLPEIEEQLKKLAEMPEAR
ncbi:MAG TPA: two-component regulator propeller domain-containing protein [Candidatus Aminicenantes bacterium]|nr:two-component regulator propeller domain-containing protein [Candidatus Aminicenantes bacterium]